MDEETNEKQMTKTNEQTNEKTTDKMDEQTNKLINVKNECTNE